MAVQYNPLEHSASSEGIVGRDSQLHHQWNLETDVALLPRHESRLGYRLNFTFL